MKLYRWMRHLLLLPASLVLFANVALADANTDIDAMIAKLEKQKETTQKDIASYDTSKARASIDPSSRQAGQEVRNAILGVCDSQIAYLKALKSKSPAEQKALGLQSEEALAEAKLAELNQKNESKFMWNDNRFKLLKEISEQKAKVADLKSQLESAKKQVNLTALNQDLGAKNKDIQNAQDHLQAQLSLPAINSFHPAYGENAQFMNNTEAAFAKTKISSLKSYSVVNLAPTNTPATPEVVNLAPIVVTAPRIKKSRPAAAPAAIASEPSPAAPVPEPVAPAPAAPAAPERPAPPIQTEASAPALVPVPAAPLVADAPKKNVDQCYEIPLKDNLKITEKQKHSLERQECISGSYVAEKCDTKSNDFCLKVCERPLGFHILSSDVPNYDLLDAIDPQIVGKRKQADPNSKDGVALAYSDVKEALKKTSGLANASDQNVVDILKDDYSLKNGYHQSGQNLTSKWHGDQDTIRKLAASLNVLLPKPGSEKEPNFCQQMVNKSEVVSKSAKNGKDYPLHSSDLSPDYTLSKQCSQNPAAEPLVIKHNRRWYQSDRELVVTSVDKYQSNSTSANILVVHTLEYNYNQKKWVKGEDLSLKDTGSEENPSFTDTEGHSLDLSTIDASAVPSKYCDLGRSQTGGNAPSVEGAH